VTLTDNVRRERERIVRDHMEAENALDFGRALQTFGHPRYEIIPTGEVYDGPDDVERYYRESREAFPDQRNELISLRHADDAVIVEFWLLGTHQGRLGRLEPTGREFRCRMTAFFIFEGTNLVCERVYFDSATIRRQLLSDD
jgi:predicted ester cyclase